MTRTLLLAAAAAFALTLTACDTTEPETEVDLSVQTAADIAADPATGRDPNTGQTIDTNRFTLFSLRTGEVVLGYDEAARDDSSSTAWDIGFRGTEIIVNGGTSGPGAGVATVVAEPFQDVATAAGLAFRRDGESLCPNSDALAICAEDESDLGWYNYVPAQNVVFPIPGRTIVVRTADGQGYAKIQILSYYQGNPDPGAITQQTPGRYYTFDYVLNAEGESFVDES